MNGKVKATLCRITASVVFGSVASFVAGQFLGATPAIVAALSGLVAAAVSVASVRFWNMVFDVRQ